MDRMEKTGQTYFSVQNRRDCGVKRPKHVYIHSILAAARPVTVFTSRMYSKYSICYDSNIGTNTRNETEQLLSK